MPLHIPDEILNHIMCYLVPVLPSKPRSWRYDPSLRPIDLASLCLVSRRFRHIAQPLLYHTIDITHSTTVTRSEKGRKRLMWPGFLLRTIVKDPRLAKYIRVLAMEDSLYIPETPDTAFLPDTSSNDFPWDVPRCIRSKLEPEIAYNGSNVPPIALLLYATMVEKIFLFPSSPDGVEVRWIVTSWQPNGRSHYYAVEFGSDQLLELGPFANYGLPCLDELYVDQEDDENWPIDLLDFLKKPGLSIFHLHHVRSSTSLFVPQPLEDSLSSVHDLKLSDCYMESQSLENILRSCPRLKVFSVHVTKVEQAEQSFQRSDPNIFWTINLEHIGQALRGFGENLIDLHLDFSNFKLARPITGRIGPLCSMPKLRHIQCYRNDLILAQELGEEQEENDLPLESVLPSSIATLNINYMEHDILLSPPRNEISAEIENILSSRRLQYLEQVRIQRYIPGTQDEPILFQTEMPGWSFDFNKTPYKDQNGFIEYLCFDRVG
ncbi:unnamed protein product [Clonostachys byssicola]|uniref:F-box domain-containing protein n=1 Tax=Clonostachys byssicola TaxID=160290 RepID=A0A9N9UY93_9HYPO|nr:unnamed protein product [Clonostachys byssicola]